MNYLKYLELVKEKLHQKEIKLEFKLKAQLMKGQFKVL